MLKLQQPAWLEGPVPPMQNPHNRAKVLGQADLWTAMRVEKAQLALAPFATPMRDPNRPMILMITGHRPSKLGGYGETPKKQWICAWLREVLADARNAERSRAGLVCLSGMALGVDQWFAEIALDLGIPLWASVPFEGHHSQWPSASQRHYSALLARTWRVSTLQTPKGPLNSAQVRRHLLNRNTWMVQRSDRAFAVWTGATGGTAHCVGQLKAKGIPTLRFDPKTQTVAMQGLP